MSLAGPHDPVTQLALGSPGLADTACWARLFDLAWPVLRAGIIAE